jgi:hypothetical protein
MAIPEHPERNRYFDPDADDDLQAKVQAPLEEMPTTSFESSNVHSGLYDFGERELYMRYLRQNGADAIYRYDDVPAREWQGLVEAASKGGYVNANIAYNYNYVQINRGGMPNERDAYRDQRVRRFVLTP